MIFLLGIGQVWQIWQAGHRGQTFYAILLVFKLLLIHVFDEAEVVFIRLRLSRVSH